MNTDNRPFSERLLGVGLYFGKEIAAVPGRQINRVQDWVHNAASQTADVIFPPSVEQFVSEHRKFLPLHEANICVRGIRNAEKYGDSKLEFFCRGALVRALVAARINPEVPRRVEEAVAGIVVEKGIVPEFEPWVSEQDAYTASEVIADHTRSNVVDIFPSLQNRI